MEGERQCWTIKFVYIVKRDSLIAQEKAASYDVNDIDEVECLRWNGRGLVGYNGKVCPLCKGDEIV